MQIKTMVRLGAVAVVAVAITMSVVQARLTPTPTEPALAAAPRAAGADLLQAELLRCQSLGAAGASDRGCLDAWATNRRHFLAPHGGGDVAVPIAGEAGEGAGERAGAPAPVPASAPATAPVEVH